MKQTPADELARMTAEFASGLIDLGGGPGVLNLDDPDQVDAYLLDIIASACDKGESAMAKTVMRLRLLADCDNELVASRVRAVLAYTPDDLRAYEDKLKARFDRLTATTREIQAVKDFLQKGHYPGFMTPVMRWVLVRRNYGTRSCERQDCRPPQCLSSSWSRSRQNHHSLKDQRDATWPRSGGAFLMA